MVVNSGGNSTIRAFFKSLIKGIQNGQILKSVVRILIKRLKNFGVKTYNDNLVKTTN